MRKFLTLTDRIVPVHHPRVLVETAVVQGADRLALFEHTGLRPAMFEIPETRISYLQYGKLTASALQLTNNPALGLDVGKNTGIPQMGVLGLALANSPTLGAMFDVWLRHYRSLVPAWDVELERTGDVAVLTLSEAVPLGPFRAYATEVLLGALDIQVRTLLGKPLPVRRIRVPYPSPGHIERYQQLFGAVMEFEQAGTNIELGREVLDTPIAFADPVTAKLAEQYHIERHGEPPACEGLVTQVRRVLLGAPGRPPDLDTLASRLQTSARSLRRALSEHGVSYLELLDDCRRTRAEEWVRGTQLTFEDIAARLGFSDVRSFRRAFKRWTRRTPGDVRGQPCAAVEHSTRGSRTAKTRNSEPGAVSDLATK